MKTLPVSAPLARYAEIDLLRGIGVVLMIAYHALFDLTFFFGMNFDLNSGIAWAIGRGAALVFVGVAGAAMVLAWKRKHETKKQPIIQRGLVILAMGMVITAFTYTFFPAYTIWFGALHLIGTAMIIGSFFVEKKRATFVLGILFTLAGIVLSSPSIQDQLPLIVPILPVAFNTFDYFPLLPWLGVFFLGMSGAHYFYPSGRQKHMVRIDMRKGIVNLLVRAGRKSLLIYFIHQPILVGIFYGIRATMGN